MPLTPRRARPPESKPKRIEACPASVVPAEDAVYVGSPEHKRYPNPVNGEAAALRSDASRCDNYPPEKWCQFTTALRAAIRAGCASEWDDAGRPKYVWGWCDGRLFQARRRSDPVGNLYKGWWIEPSEQPVNGAAPLKVLRSQLEQRGG